MVVATGKVLVIDDEASLRSVVESALGEVGYQAQSAHDGVEGLRRLFQWQPDLVILDVMMPRMDGWETCRRIREVCDVPILMLTAKDGQTHELKGLSDGADLYMTKPFGLTVLLARVEALLRRSRVSGQTGQTVVVGDLKIDLAKYELTLGGCVIDLSRTEFRLLAALASNPEQVIPHRDLLAQVWGPEYVEEDLYLKLYIRYLRQKIEEDPSRPRYILTRRGIGYYLTDGSTR